MVYEPANIAAVAMEHGLEEVGCQTEFRTRFFQEDSVKGSDFTEAEKALVHLGELVISGQIEQVRDLAVDHVTDKACVPPLAAQRIERNH
jgi:hypothetical protein